MVPNSDAAQREPGSRRDEPAAAAPWDPRAAGPTPPATNRVLPITGELPFADAWNRAMSPTRAGSAGRRRPVRPVAPDEPDEDRWAAHARIRP